ncbi:hypothetical protein EG329_006281 [Mollisiaceae sp. DMI_Dod_QoI]|nr:hypothetical protein EG329_006281 [Helotiales sp. DMI_Dod_QoI]
MALNRARAQRIAQSNQQAEETSVINVPECGFDPSSNYHTALPIRGPKEIASLEKEWKSRHLTDDVDKSSGEARR